MYWDKWGLGYSSRHKYLLKKLLYIVDYVHIYVVASVMPYHHMTDSTGANEPQWGPSGCSWSSIVLTGKIVLHAALFFLSNIRSVTEM